MSAAMKGFLLLVMTSLVIFPSDTSGKPGKELSLRTARVLSFLPINSPAMYYTRHPVRGTLYTLSEGFGLAMGIAGTIIAVSFSSADSDGLFGEVNDAMLAGGILGMVLGYGVLWGYPWVKTVVVTPRYAREYNERLRSPSDPSLTPVSIVPLWQTPGLRLSLRF